MNLAGQLRQWCRGQRDDMVRLLERLVNVPSHATQRDGVAQVAQLLGEPLAQLGFSIGERPPPPLPAELAWLESILSPEAPYARLASSYVAQRAGRGERPLLLLGDLDTSAPPGSSTSVPFSVAGRRAYGAGVADMKGGLVVMLTALRALHVHGVPAPPITIVLAGDEQAGSLASRLLVERAAAEAAWCLCFECARDGGRLMHTRGHIGVGEIVARGREAHAGSAWLHGRNALDALARAIVAVDSLTRPESGTFVTVTLATGGRRRSVIPGYARAVIDVRTRDAAAWADVTRMIEAAVRSVDVPDVRLETRLYAHRPGFRPDAHTEGLLVAVREAARSVGVDVSSVESAAAGSSAFAGAAGVPTIDGMGPSGGDLLTPGEYIELDSLAPRAALAAVTIQVLSRREPVLS